MATSGANDGCFGSTMTIATVTSASSTRQNAMIFSVRDNASGEAPLWEPRAGDAATASMWGETALLGATPMPTTVVWRVHGRHADRCIDARSRISARPPDSRAGNPDSTPPASLTLG